jgi:hypothetical protein
MTYEDNPTSAESPDEHPDDESSFEFTAEDVNAIELITGKYERRSGVKTKYGVFLGEDCVAGKDVDVQTDARSVSKLPLANMAIDRLPPTQEVTIKKEDVLPGGSGLDHLTQDTTVTVSILLDALIRESSNTAYRTLAKLLEGPDAINDYYSNERGWKSTNVGDHEGRALMGETTMREAHMQLRSLLNGSTGDPTLRIVTQNGLKNNAATKTGARQVIVPSEELTLYNKTGELNKGKLQGDRLDVGVIRGPKGELGYAIAASGIAMLANWEIAEVTANIARMAGARDIRPIASLAIRSFGLSKK